MVKVSSHGVKAIAQGTQVTSERLRKLAEFVDRGVITVRIDKTFPLDQAGAALTYLQTGSPKGKVVLLVRKES